MPNPFLALRARLAALGAYSRRKSPLLAKTPKLNVWLEWAARLGHGARGFVFLSMGVVTLMAATDIAGEAVGTKGAIIWLADQPFGRAWLFLTGLGLCAFVMWRLLQSIFDADHEGSDREGLMTRASQFFSAIGYSALAFNAFALLFRAPSDPAMADIVRSHQQASTVLDLPYGRWILIGVGLAILAIGVANVTRAWREDFTQYLACSEKLCRRVAPLARAGYVARGVAYLPLGLLVAIAGWRSSPSDVTSFSAALDAVERQPAGPMIVALTALGFIAFGLFSLIEARFRRIRPPRDLNPLK